MIYTSIITVYTESYLSLIFLYVKKHAIYAVETEKQAAAAAAAAVEADRQAAAVVEAEQHAEGGGGRH